MAIVITNAGKQKALSYLVGKDYTTDPLILRLFTNNLTPEVDDDISVFTETTGGGYATKSLDPVSWTVQNGSATYPQQTWTFTGNAGTVYGYYITRNSVISPTSYSLSSATTTTTEAIASGEKLINVTSDASFPVNSYAKLAANNQSSTPFEIVKVLYTESNVLYVDRAQLSTSQLAHNSGITATILTITQDTTTTDVIFAERFPNGPYTVANSGDIIRVTLSLGLT